MLDGRWRNHEYALMRIRIYLLYDVYVFVIFFLL